MTMMEEEQVPGVLLLLWVPWETGSGGLNRDSPLALVMIIFCK